MFPLGRTLLKRAESAIGVFAIHGFAIDPADLVLVGFDIHLCRLVERHAHHLVQAHGGIVPVNFIYRDVIGAGLAFRACGRCNGQSSKEHKGTKDCKLTLLFHGTLQREMGRWRKFTPATARIWQIIEGLCLLLQLGNVLACNE